MTLPLHLRATDLFGIRIPQGHGFPEQGALRAVYGLCQIVCTGAPDLQDKGRADATVAALLRDATLSLAACLIVAERNLYEPILRLHRGILEARLIVQKLRAGDGERSANLLAADRLLARKRAFQRQITIGLRPASDPWLRKHLNDIKRTLRNDPALRAAQAELQKLRAKGLQWHGAANLAQLSAELGESSSYELTYTPLSALFVHPGDVDVQLEEVESSIRMRPLVCEDQEKLRSVLRSLIAEAYQLLVAAIEPWQVGREIRLAIDKAIPLMMLALDPRFTSKDQVAALEEGSGLLQHQWTGALTITFDWEAGQVDRPRRRAWLIAISIVAVAALAAIIIRVLGF